MLSWQGQHLKGQRLYLGTLTPKGTRECAVVPGWSPHSFTHQNLAEQWRHGGWFIPRVRVIEKIQHKPLVSTLHWWTNRFQYFDSILCWKIETICVVFFNTACVVFFNTAKPWNLILGVLNILFFACHYCLISALVRHLLFLQSLALFQGCPWPGFLHFSIIAAIFPEYTFWKDSINR